MRKRFIIYLRERTRKPTNLREKSMNANLIHEILGGKIIDKNLSGEEILVLWLKDIGSQSNESLKYVHDQRGYAIRGVDDDTPVTMKNNWDVKLCFPDFELLAAMMFADLLFEFSDQAGDAAVRSVVVQKLNPELVS